MKSRILEFISYLGVTNKEFERRCGMSNGYINSMRKGLGVNMIENVLSAYPELNRIWLITGQGEMLNGQNGNVVVGDNNIAHNISSNINSSATIDNLVALLEKTHQDNIAKDEQIKKKDEQIDRLLSLLEKAQKQ